MGIIKRIFLLCFSLFLGFCASAQISPESAPVQKIDGKKYYLHQVQKGHTLYAISKAYSVSVDDIVAANPEAKNGIQIFQVLRIPLYEVDKKDAKSNPPVLKNGELIHVVEKKETLYGICKKYNVPVEALLAANDSSIYSLKIGQQLIIPVHEIPQVGQKEVAPAAKDSFITHRVEPKETLYSLARTYKVNIDSIRILNGGLIDGLKIGSLIRIPKLDPEYQKMAAQSKPMLQESPKRQIKRDSVTQKSTYHMALLLPLYLDMNDTLAKDEDTLNPYNIYKPSEIGISFFKGFKLAVDTINDTSAIQFTYTVFDTQNDTARVMEIVNSKEFQKADVVIGPFYRSNFELVAKATKTKEIPAVCPVPQSNSILLDNPHVMKTSPSMAVQIERVAHYIFDTYENQNIILFDSRKVKDQPQLEVFKDVAYERLYSNPFDTLVDSLRIVKMYDIDTAQIRRELNDSLVNLLVLPSSDQVYVTEFLTKLFNYKDSFDIKVFGLENWTNYNNLEVAYLHDLDVHIPSIHRSELSDTATQRLYKRFRERYATEPNFFALTAYDLVLYLTHQLQSEGKYFMDNYQEEEQLDFHSMGFSFFKPIPNSGFENKAVQIVHYHNYELVPPKP